MVNKSTKRKENLLGKQKKLIQSLGTISPFIIGSITVVKRICGNKKCQCRKNPEKKHPAMYLTWKENNKTKALYIPVIMEQEVKSWSENYKTVKKVIQKISDVQKDLLKLH
jgi:hypothetical protein